MKYFLSVFLFLAGVGMFACSPYFPNSYFYKGDFGNEAHPRFLRELELIVGEQGEYLNRYRSLRPAECSTTDAEEADFRRLVPNGDAAAYRRLAQAVRSGGNADWNSVPDLPESLRLFLLGWEIVRNRKPEEPAAAPVEWKTLAEQPERYPDRTVWACYMLGNLAAAQRDPAGRRKWHELCRRRVDEGYSDAAGLGFATLKHEIRESSGEEQIRFAFLAYALRPEKRDGAGKLLRYLISKEAARSVMRKLGLSADPVVRELYAAYFMNQPDYEMERRPVGPFVDAVAKSPLKPKNAARMAYLARLNGDSELMRRWLALVEREDALSDWLNAEAARQDGRQDEALKYLRSWLARLPERGERFSSDFRWDWGKAADTDPDIVLSLADKPDKARITSTEENGVYARIGTIHVEKNELEQALFYFLRANALMDAAHIAEHLMATEDLLRYVSAFAATRFQTLPQDRFRFLQNVVSRRLIREGRFTEAAQLMRPTSIRYALLMLYMQELRESVNPSLPADLRSLHLYNAARVMYWKGMELAGCCSSPDFALYDGQFWTEPGSRFHYRIQALDMIWQAASMARDKSLKALCLYSGGIYALRAFREENPAKTADLFYKRLVRECRFLPLAVYCDRRRWFAQDDVTIPVLKTIEPLSSLRQVRQIVRDSVPRSKEPTLFRPLMKP